MAELGSTFKLSGQENVQVDVEMLDYEFVNNCKDVALVNAILEVLKSGKEGIYPDVCCCCTCSHLLAFTI